MSIVFMKSEIRDYTRLFLTPTYHYPQLGARQVDPSPSFYIVDKYSLNVR